MTLDELEALAKAATPGPWEAEEYQHGDAATVDGPPIRGYEGEIPRADARFIAAANPATVLALIARLRATEALVLAAFCESFHSPGEWQYSDAKAALDRLREGK